jgi:hypothetical protein
MHRRRCHVVLFLSVLAALLAGLSCGSPERPSEPRPTLTINAPSDVLHVGQSVDVVLEAVFSDGRTAFLTPLWGTDRPDILHVWPMSASRQGGWEGGWDQRPASIDHMLFARVTGLTIGEAAITAKTQYGMCERPVRVID